MNHMFCIYCGRLGDFNDTYTCDECRKKLQQSDKMQRVLSLLAKAYRYVPDIHLREKIEEVLPTEQLEIQDDMW